MRFLSILLAGCSCGFGAARYGALVDAGCFAAEQRNVNPTDTMTAVDQDVNSEIRYCSPRAKTKAFALVEPDNSVLRLDAAGNAKAADLMRGERKAQVVRVVVNGTEKKDTIAVASLEPAK